MQVVTSVQQMREMAREWQRDERARVAFVPTMGALHKGHASLVAIAKDNGNKIVLSSFVNPLQFNDPKDLEAYPRTPEEDRKLAKAAGVDVFFEPDGKDLFPPGYLTTVAVSHLSRRLEGESRPGHFRGVTTVVLKLFNIVRPHVAVFGYKDAQQFTIISQMVRDLALDIQIIGAPTVRDTDGLALSSRNVRLTPEQRKQALCLVRSLRRVHFLTKKQGIVHCGELLQAVRSHINSAGPDVKLDYARIVSRATLEDLSNIERGNTYVLVAATVGGVRLIDSTRL